MLMFVTTFSLTFTSCGDDEPKPNDGSGTIDPTTPIADPDGTISLAMHNKSNGATSLGQIAIGDDNNFYFKGYFPTNLWFADLGEMAGLGNITSIPMSSWASEVQVIPGHGYVAILATHDANQEFRPEDIYRIYVIDYITSINGGIIGAHIKYQTPFNGEDIAISLDKTSIDVSKENIVKITNKSFVPFKIDVEGNFTCKRITKPNAPFITTGLDISPNGIPSSDGETGKIILTTYGGNTTELPVSYSATDKYINIDQATVSFAYKGASAYNSDNRDPTVVHFDTNIDGPQAILSNDASWIKADISFDDKAAHQGHINIYTSTNCTAETRKANIVLTKGEITKNILVEQTGVTFFPQIPDVIELSLNNPDFQWGGLRYYEIHPYEGCDLSKGSYIKFEEGYAQLSWDAEWIQRINYKGDYFEIVCDTSYKSGTEETTVSIYYQQYGDIFDNILVKKFKIRWK